jgi:hypothetical protein
MIFTITPNSTPVPEECFDLDNERQILIETTIIASLC